VSNATTYIALLRAVNLPAHNKISMADLLGLLGRLEFESPRTLLQSGNAVFRAAPRATSALESLLEEEAERRLGLRTDFLVRTAEEWRKLIARNPFPDQAEADPSHLVVMCTKAALAASAVRELQAAVTGPELVRAAGRQAYIVYPDGIGGSPLTTALIEKKLRTRGTGRNWNTVLKLDALARA
jgi:uncharacterized protein (DUF1697 family)